MSRCLIDFSTTVHEARLLLAVTDYGSAVLFDAGGPSRFGGRRLALDRGGRRVGSCANDFEHVVDVEPGTWFGDGLAVLVDGPATANGPGPDSTSLLLPKILNAEFNVPAATAWPLTLLPPMLKAALPVPAAEAARPLPMATATLPILL